MRFHEEKKNQGSTRVKHVQLQVLRRDFETLHIKVGEYVTNYCAIIMEISNKMRFSWWEDGWWCYCWKNIAFFSNKIWLCCMFDWRIKRHKYTLSWWTVKLFLVDEQKMNWSSNTNEQALKALWIEVQIQMSKL